MFKAAIHTGRAGGYVTQPGGYRAFMPKLLPPDPPVRFATELHRRLSDADRALGRLDGSLATLPNPNLFVYMYVRKEAVLSSQIEGTQSSLQDLLAAEAHLAEGVPSDVDEVVNYVRAMNFGLERLSTLPVSVRLIREIHKELLTGARGERLTPGQLRQSQNWIGPPGSTIATATFVPPPPSEVASLLGDVEMFLHREDDVPLLIKIGLAHAQFETIHPFLDGNGRIGRLLITFLLCERRALQKPVLYLSHYFKTHRLEYYDRLQAVRDGGDWEGWLSFFLDGVAAVSLEAAATARQILVMREDHRRQINDRLGRMAGDGHRVLDQLYEKPIVSIEDVRQITKTTFQAANTLVGRMVEAEILKEMTGRARNRRFQYAPYVALFNG
jgi:Fic family protein